MIFHEFFQSRVAAVCKSGGLRSHLIKSTGGTFVLKVVTTGLSFLTVLFLARVLGAEEYGAFAYAMTWVAMLGVPATLGFHQLLVREVAIYSEREQWGLLQGLLRFSNLFVLAVSITLSIIAALVAWMLLESKGESPMLLAFLVSLLILPFSALTQLRQATMRGLQQIIRGQFPELIIRPILFLLILGVVVFFFRQYLTAQLAVALNLIAFIIAFSVGLYWLNKMIPIKVKAAIPQFRIRVWLIGAFPLMVIAGMQLISFQSDILFLGLYQNSAQVGVYVVAKQVSGLIAFGLLAIEVSIAPTIAMLYATGQNIKLQRMISKSIIVLIGVSLPVVLLLIFFGEYILLLFGAEFTSGFSTLVVLGLGQLVNVSFGPIGQIAIHTGHEKNTAIIVGIGAILNISLNLLLIPKWGMNGAAIAATTSLICWNLMLAVYIYKRTGIITGPILLIRKIV